jgi:hypothetical protein
MTGMISRRSAPTMRVSGVFISVTSRKLIRTLRWVQARVAHGYHKIRSSLAWRNGELQDRREVGQKSLFGDQLIECAGSYAPGIVPQIEAAKEGYGQILWLSGEDHTLTEVGRLSLLILKVSLSQRHQVGTMNLFVAFKKPDGTVELVTPPLDDMILPGVVRDRSVALPITCTSSDR